MHNAKTAFRELVKIIEERGVPEEVHLTSGTPDRMASNVELRQMCAAAGYDINFVESEENITQYAERPHFYRAAFYVDYTGERDRHGILQNRQVAIGVALVELGKRTKIWNPR